MFLAYFPTKIYDHFFRHSILQISPEKTRRFVLIPQRGVYLTQKRILLPHLLFKNYIFFTKYSENFTGGGGKMKIYTPDAPL